MSLWTSLRFQFLVSIFVLLVVVFHADTSAAQTIAAQITYPTDGATNADMSQPIQWTTVVNAQAYYLYLGTTLGAKDLLNSGEVQATYHLTSNLPFAQTVFARLWTKSGGTWRSTDSTFTVPVPVTATMTSPVNGALDVDLSQAMHWRTVLNTEAYYLYVGTTLGAKDLINSGEIQLTSYLSTSLPLGQTVFVRIHTKVGGVWRFRDSTFTTAAVPVTATITSPVTGASNVNQTSPIQWTTVVNAQAYYLYVGTILGTKNLVNTGEIHQTSYAPASLPAGQTVYARIHTLVGGVWRHADRTFSVAPTAPVTATVTYPANGATNADLSQPIQWTTVANVQAYYLYVGSTLGTKNLVDTGETQLTSYPVISLPAGQTVYARIYAKVGNVWRYTDSSFTVVSLAAQFSFPLEGARNVTTRTSFTWAAVLNADAYFVYLGTTPGSGVLPASGELITTTYRPTSLPANTTVYARLYTLFGGVWRHSPDISFSTGTLTSRFVFPARGSVAVELIQPFQWTPVADAAGYRLIVSSTPGGSDLVDTGTIHATSYSVPSVPVDRVLYGRIYTLIDGTWRFGDTVFTLMPKVQPAEPSYPIDGATDTDAGQPFQWNAVDIADGYRLELGTLPGAHDLHDSGLVRVTRRFVPNVPTGVTIYGRLSTSIGGQWIARGFTYTAVTNTIAASTKVASALWATHVVWSMAPLSGSPLQGSPQIASELSDVLSGNGKAEPVCTDYALELQSVLAQMNIGSSARILNVALNPNGYDGHTLVEMKNDETGRWMLLDPTFDLSVRRAADDEWATAEEMSISTRAGRWSDMSYVFTGTSLDSWVQQYYLDYPLLFVNVYHWGQPAVNGVGGTVLPYLTSAALPATGARQIYVAGCSDVTTAELLIDGTITTIDCNGVDRLSHAFWAANIGATTSTPASLTLYRPLRFVF